MKKYQKILAVICCLFIFFNIGYSNDNQKFLNDYKEKTIYLQDALFVFNIKYYQGNNGYKVGNNYSNLYKELARFPESNKLALAGIKKIRQSEMLIPLVYIASLTLFSQNQLLAGFGTFYVGTFVSQNFYISGKNSIQQAVWQYNFQQLQ